MEVQADQQTKDLAARDLEISGLKDQLKKLREEKDDWVKKHGEVVTAHAKIRLPCPRLKLPGIRPLAKSPLSIAHWSF